MTAKRWFVLVFGLDVALLAFLPSSSSRHSFYFIPSIPFYIFMATLYINDFCILLHVIKPQIISFGSNNFLFGQL